MSDQKQILLGRGSDEAIDLLVRSFCRAGTDSVLICPPTYGVYKVAAGLQGAHVTEVPLLMSQQSGVWQAHLDESSIKAKVCGEGSPVKLVFICTPNNPTGTAFPIDQIERLCKICENRSLVVVDEAYLEFSEGPSCLGLVSRFPNLVVLRTFSKAWALAGLRLGLVAGSQELIALLQKVRAPYPLSTPQIEAAIQSLSPLQEERTRARVQTLVERRHRMASRFADLGCVEGVFKSSGNFLLVRFKDSSAVVSAARSAGLILRDFSHELSLANCVRITIGAEAEMENLLSIIGGLQ